MSSLAATVNPDSVDGVIIVELHGVLDLQTAPQLRAVLLGCLARGPDAVVVDVTHLQLADRAQLTVFPAALRTSGGQATMVLCGADRELREPLDGPALGTVTVQPDRASALATVRGPGPGQSSHRLEPTPGAPSAARRLVAAACAEWGLDALAGPASLVVSELVSNAVQHAGTSMVIRLARGGDLLRVSVQDFSRELPRAAMNGDTGETGGGPLAIGGRGLHLVDTYATAWGSDVSDDGKTVWATLRLPRDT